MTRGELKDRVSRLSSALEQLRPSQLNWIESVVAQFGRPAAFSPRQSRTPMIPASGSGNRGHP
jgi:hypothetical protein